MSEPTNDDRLLVSIRQLIKSILPNEGYGGTYEYAVQKVSDDGSTADASPTSSDTRLPSIVRIRLRSGLLGETAKLTVGNRCLVQFINKDPTRPIVIGSDPIPEKCTIDASSEMDIGPTATVIQIGGTGLAAARRTDPVVAGPFMGTITGGSTKVTIG